jgi:hypothetical protein
MKAVKAVKKRTSSILKLEITFLLVLFALLDRNPDSADQTQYGSGSTTRLGRV